MKPIGSFSVTNCFGLGVYFIDEYNETITVALVNGTEEPTGDDFIDCDIEYDEQGEPFFEAYGMVYYMNEMM